MISEPRLLIRTMSGSVALPQLGSVLMFMVHDTTKDHMNAPRTGPQPVVMLVPKGCAATGSCQSGWPMLLRCPLVMSRHKLLPGTTAGSVFLLQLGSVMKSLTHVSRRGHRNHAY